tara:strand:- start:3332 stop:4033 length:702 start_codon:yes stop_codon:yes gene_type:complete
MPLNFNNLFPRGQDIQISGSSTDITTRVVLVNYDCVGFRPSSGDEYKLVKSAETDNPTLFNTLLDHTLVRHQVNGTTVNSGTLTTSVDIDFDSEILQQSIIVEGTALVKATWAVWVGGVGSQRTSQIIVRLRKWDGTTETEIANHTNVGSNDAGSDSDVSGTFNITVPRTTIKKGEQIRLTVNILVRDTSGTEDTAAMLAINPINTAVTGNHSLSLASGNTRCILQLPVRVQE